jgi:glycosyltransferase 2 family protein
MLKRIALIVFQLVITAAGLWYVFHDPHKQEEIVRALRQADRRWIAAGWLCYGVVEFLATVRWQLLLRLQNVRLSWWRAGGIVMIGLFFNMFLPGLIGGDLMRLYFVYKEAPGRAAPATLSVAMDRLFGLLSVLFLACVSVSVRFRWFKQIPATSHILVLVVVLLSIALVAVSLLVALINRKRTRRLPKRFPLRRPLIESARALELYRGHYRWMIVIFIITIASHLAYYITYYCALKSLQGAAGNGIALADVLVVMPLVNTITAIPVSFGGVGLRETLFQELLGNLAHLPNAIAALGASLGYLLQASWGILGAGVYLWARKIWAAVASEARHRFESM